MRDFEGVAGPWRGAGGDRGEAGEHLGQLETAVEAILELGEIAEYIAHSDRFQSSHDRRFDIPEHGIHPAETWEFLGMSVLGRDHGRMRAAGFRHGTEAAEPVRDDARRGLQMRLRHRLDLGAVVNLHDMQQQTQRPPVIAGLDGHDERGLVGPRTPTFAAIQLAFLAAEHGIVHLDATVELAARLALEHHRHQLVAHQCRRVGPHTQLARQLQCRDRVLRLREQIHALEPFDVRQQRARKNSAGFERGLLQAVVAQI